jgi:hypothetical protein
MERVYTYEEIAELKEFITNLGMNLPEDKLTYVWSNYKRIADVNEPQPCSCQSSSGLWIKAVDTIRNFVKTQG